MIDPELPNGCPVVLAMRIGRDPSERRGQIGRTGIQRLRHLLKALAREWGFRVEGYDVPLANPTVRPGGEYI